MIYDINVCSNFSRFFCSRCLKHEVKKKWSKNLEMLKRKKGKI